MKRKVLSLILAVSMLGMTTACSKDTSVVNENDIVENEQELSVDTTEQTTPETSVSESTTDVVNLLESMSQGERTEVNQFLSNFSEAYYAVPYSYGAYSEEEEKISFAFIHSMLNRGESSTIKYENSEMGISAEEVDLILNRFFGSSVPHETPSYSQEFVYKNGYFMMCAADGETYSYFTIATDMREHSGGNYMVKFSVFYDNENPHEMLQSWYSLTYNEAISNSQYSHSYDGEAILKPKGDTYQIVSYTTYENEE